MRPFYLFSPPIFIYLEARGQVSRSESCPPSEARGEDARGASVRGRVKSAEGSFHDRSAGEAHRGEANLRGFFSADFLFERKPQKQKNKKLKKNEKNNNIKKLGGRKPALSERAPSEARRERSSEPERGREEAGRRPADWSTEPERGRGPNEPLTRARGGRPKGGRLVDLALVRGE
jgi:hypothetical protein